MEKENCWEFYGCGRNPGGDNVSDLGICPVTTARKLDGVHGGRNAGRACWVVGGTLCNDEMQGSFAKKYERCTECDFYKKVEHEEGPSFLLSASLFMMLH